MFLKADLFRQFQSTSVRNTPVSASVGTTPARSVSVKHFHWVQLTGIMVVHIHSHFRDFSPDCTLHTAITHMISVLERWTHTITPLEFIPFQYCYQVSYCSVQCAIGTKNSKWLQRRSSFPSDLIPTYTHLRTSQAVENIRMLTSPILCRALVTSLSWSSETRGFTEERTLSWKAFQVRTGSPK